MPRKLTATLLGGLAAALLDAPSAESAQLLGFGDATCNGGGACSNSTEIDETYGDLPGLLDVRYDADLASDPVGPLTFWDTGYGTLHGVAFGGGLAGTQVAEIFLAPEGGASVHLTGLDLGAWLSQSRNTQLTILDGDDTPLYSSGALAVDGVTHFDFDLESDTGIKIQWGPTAYYVAVDNVSFEVVPEPGSAALLALGLAGLAGAGRVSRAATGAGC